jgi:CubicO group peptidase (beta-lactamase class C family)
MQAPIASGWTAGGAVAISVRGQLVFVKGYGLANLETRTPVSPNTVFRIGSLTKQFTATALLLLAEDGALSVDDPVSKYLPAFPREDATTIRQLLTHTSGIREFVGAEGFDTETRLPHTTDQLVEYVLRAQPLHVFEPGVQMAYSNSNYALAGAIVERVTDSSLGAFMKARIFDPLGMSHTALDRVRDVVLDRASGYDRIRVETAGYANARPIDMSVPFGAGAMRSTVGDLVIWANALTQGKVLKDSTYRLMITPARLASGELPARVAADGSRSVMRYGTGLGIEGPPNAPTLVHDGGIDGFTATIRIYTAAGVVVAAMVNTSPSPHLPFGRVVAAVEEDPVLTTADWPSAGK